MDLLYVGIAILLIAVNAFFAMAEYSLVRIRESRLEELARQGKRLAPLIRFALDHLDGYMSTVQLGITMTSLGLGWVGEPAVARLIHRLFPLLDRSSATGIATSLSFLVAFLLITGLHILFGELVPKLMAVRNPERYAGFTILPMTGFYYLAFVPMQALRRAANGVLRLFGIKGSACRGGAFRGRDQDPAGGARGGGGAVAAAPAHVREPLRLRAHRGPRGHDPPRLHRLPVLRARAGRRTSWS